MDIDFPSSKKRIQVKSPWSSLNVRRILNKSYNSLSSSIATSDRTQNETIASLTLVIRKEMKDICSLDQASILMDDVEALRHFSWESIWLELKIYVPTLVKVLVGILPDGKEAHKIISLIVCMLLKNRFSKMSLLQRAISIMLYANGCSKKVKLYTILVMHCLYNRSLIAYNLSCCV